MSLRLLTVSDSVSTPVFSPVSRVSSPLLLSPASPHSPLQTYTVSSVSTPFSASVDDTRVLSVKHQVIYTPRLVNDDNVSLFIPGTSYMRPTLSMYDNLNADKRVRKMVTKFFVKKILGKWIYDEMSDILNYLKISNGKVTPLDKITEHKPTAHKDDSEANTKLKVEFLEDNIVTYENMYRIIQKYVKYENVNWYDLPRSHVLFKRALMKEVIHMLKN